MFRRSVLNKQRRVKGFVTFLAVVLVIGGGLYFWRSSTLEKAGPIASSENDSQPVPAPVIETVSPTTPVSVVQPQIKKTPEPAEQTAKLPRSVSIPELGLVAIAQNRALWPKQVLLVKPVAFPVGVNQRPLGSVTLPAGRAVDVLAITAQGLTLSFQGATQLVPADSTNVIEAARRMQSPPVASGSVPSGEGKAGGPLSLPPAAGPSPLPPLEPGWALAADRMLVLKGPELLAQDLAQKRQGLAPVPQEAPDYRDAHVWGRHQLLPFVGEPPQFYATASGLLDLAVPRLRSGDWEPRCVALLLILDVAESAADTFQDYDLSTVLAELYLMPNVAFASSHKGSYRNRSDVAFTIINLMSPRDYPRKKKAFELAMKFADSPGMADAARYRLASFAHEHGQKSDALAALRAINSAGDLAGVRSLIPALEKEMKPKKKP